MILELFIQLAQSFFCLTRSPSKAHKQDSPSTQKRPRLIPFVCSKVDAILRVNLMRKTLIRLDHFVLMVRIHAHASLCVYT